MGRTDEEESPEQTDEEGLSIGAELDRLNEPLISMLNKVIRFAVRILAVLMALVIVWGVLDVIWILYQRLRAPPFLLLNISDILATFGGFIAVLIAVEIFLNIVLYLRENAIHIKLVLATALMAIARKVIVFDYAVLTPDYVWASAAVIIALSVGYWLVARKR